MPSDIIERWVIADGTERTWREIKRVEAAAEPSEPRARSNSAESKRASSGWSADLSASATTLSRSCNPYSPYVPTILPLSIGDYGTAVSLP